MELSTLRELLRDADEKKYGVGLFNILNLEMLRGITAAAEAERSPLIIGVAEVHLPIIPFDWAAHLMKKAAAEATVPVCLHLDHGMTKEVIFAAMEAGFSSVMYDGSALPYEENVANTREIVKEAKKYGVSVEAELGHVGTGDNMDDPANQYTEPDQVVDFLEKTGVDALAVAIGTAHGKYARKPLLDLNRLEEIKAVSKVPLVLHGGSGLSDDDFRNTIRCGIAKVNICTDMCLAAAHAYESQPTLEQGVPAAVAAVRQVVTEKMRLFGSSGRA